MGQPLAEGATRLDGLGQLAQGVLQHRVAFLVAQHAESSQQRQARVNQRGQLPREGRQDLRFDLAGAEPRDLDIHLETLFLGPRGPGRVRGRGGSRAGPGFGWGGLLRLGHVRREIPHLPNPRHRGSGALTVDLAGDFLAFGIQRDVMKFWHCSVLLSAERTNDAITAGVHWFILLGVLQHFLNRCQPVQHVALPILPQRPHPQFLRLGADHARWCALVDQLANWLRHDQ